MKDERPRRGSGACSSRPWDGDESPPRADVFSDWEPSEPRTFGIFTGNSSRGHGQLSTQFPAPLSRQDPGRLAVPAPPSAQPPGPPGASLRELKAPRPREARGSGALCWEQGWRPLDVLPVALPQVFSELLVQVSEHMAPASDAQGWAAAVERWPRLLHVSPNGCPGPQHPCAGQTPHSRRNGSPGSGRPTQPP